MSQENLKKALTDWCNNNLKLGVTWPGHFNPGQPCAVLKPRTFHMGGVWEKKLEEKENRNNQEINRDGQLIYQDGTSCSAGHVYHDVYLLDDGTYQIYTSGAFAECTGGNHKEVDVPSTNHKDIIEMMTYLIENDGWDANSTRTLVGQDIGNYLAKMVGEPDEIERSELEIQILKKRKPVDLRKVTDNDKNIINGLYAMKNKWMENRWNRHHKEKYEAERKAMLEKDKLKDTIGVASQVLGDIAYGAGAANKELSENRLIDNTKIKFAEKYGVTKDYKSLLKFLCGELYTYQKQIQK